MDIFGNDMTKTKASLRDDGAEGDEYKSPSKHKAPFYTVISCKDLTINGTVERVNECLSIRHSSS